MRAFLALACTVATVATVDASAVAAVDASGPVIGILAQPGTFCASAATCDPSGPWTWTPEILIASYVKWIEASGARVVPIRSTASAAERESLFASINGLLIPGGDDITLTEWNNAYNNATRAWLQLAFDANRAGDPFAIWATCQGFEQLAVFASAGGPAAVLETGVDAEALFVPLSWWPAPGAAGPPAASALFRGAPPSVVAALGTQNMTVNFHSWGVAPTTLQRDAKLAAAFRILATGRGRGGKAFVALMESAEGFPIFASQFHPEKNQFEWSLGLPPAAQTEAAVLATQWLGARFVASARKSTHAFPSGEALRAALIYNSQPVFTSSSAASAAAAPGGGQFLPEQVYMI